MKIIRFVLAVWLCLLLASACVRTPRVSPPMPPEHLEPGVRRLDYTIQLGAFAEVDNAIRLARTLTREGWEAFYFRHESGLYKVRCGDFSSREKAQAEADRLVKSGIVSDYYLVAPESYRKSPPPPNPERSLRRGLIAAARSYLGLPYVWGGETPEEGFDCSGLTMAVYRLNGLDLPRSSRAQFEAGRSIPWRLLRAGDLVFFATARNRRVSHVGIYIGDGKFIHAPSTNRKIRVDSLLGKYYTQRIIGARTYLD